MRYKHHAICPKCVRVVSKDEESEAQDVVEQHNDQLHDGEQIARVVGPYKEDLNEFIDEVRDEFDYNTFEKISQHIVKTDPWDIH